MELPPDTDEPLFITADPSVQMPYPGADPDIEPTFDYEIEHDPETVGEYGAKVPAVGKGPSRGYEERWRAIARLHALGRTNNQIAALLGYSATGISLALNKPWVRSEVERFRAQYEIDIVGTVKEASADGAKYIHSVILNEHEKPALRLDASKWAVDKTTGKAKQEVSVESGTLGTFMDILKEMSQRGEGLDVLDVTPNADPVPTTQRVDSKEETSNTWDVWLDQNLEKDQNK